MLFGIHGRSLDGFSHLGIAQHLHQALSSYHATHLHGKIEVGMPLHEHKRVRWVAQLLVPSLEIGCD